jgi:hypothetical protein
MYSKVNVQGKPYPGHHYSRMMYNSSELRTTSTSEAAKKGMECREGKEAVE